MVKPSLHPSAPSPQQPIPRVTTDLAPTAASTKDVESIIFFPKMLIFFFFSEKVQAAYLIVYFAYLF